MIRVACACTVTISNVEITANPPTTVEHGIRNANGGTINLDHVYQHGNIDALCWCGNGSISDSYSTIHLAISSDHLENIYLDDAQPEDRPQHAPQRGAADRQHLREHAQRKRRALREPPDHRQKPPRRRRLQHLPLRARHLRRIVLEPDHEQQVRALQDPPATRRRGNVALHRRPRLLRLLPERRLLRLPRLRVLRQIRRAHLERERLGRQQHNHPLLTQQALPYTNLKTSSRPAPRDARTTIGGRTAKSRVPALARMPR